MTATRPERGHAALLRSLATLIWLSVCIGIVAALGAWLGRGAPMQGVGYVQGPLGVLAIALSGVVYATAGVFLLRRSPRDVIGWLFLAIGAGMTIALPLDQLVDATVHPFRAVPLGTLLATWAVGAFHLPLSGAAVVVVLLLFPTGRPEWPWWRPTLALALLGAACLALATAFRPEGQVWFATLPNPAAAPAALAPLISLVSAVGIAALVAGLAMAAACLVWRYRHGSVRERRQLAWVALGTTTMVAGVALLFVGRYADLTTQEEGERLAMLAAVGAVLLPLAMVRYAMVTDALGQQTSDLTFLFTDLKDSTAMYERVGDVTAFDIVRLHFDMLESATRRHGGAIVKTLGDAIMARFFDPEDAVRTALEMFARLAPFDALGSGNLVLKVGLHRGDAIVITSKGRRDYFGQTVNIAARMQALAEAGEIVLSREVFESPGVARLLVGREVRAEQAVIRGVSGEVSVYRVLVAPPVAVSPTLEPAT